MSNPPTLEQIVSLYGPNRAPAILSSALEQWKVREWCEGRFTRVADLSTDDRYQAALDSGWDPDGEEDPPEFFEFYAVKRGVNFLRRAGAAVLRRNGAWVWCRETTGQAVHLDAVIIDAYMLSGAA
jgi:hypothetical protein